VNGFGGDFQFLREGGGVWIPSGLNRLMNAQHALERRAFAQLGLG
jgi:hypothetical protein